MTTDDPGLGSGMRAQKQLLGGIVCLLLTGWLLQSCGIDFNVRRLAADACRECGADGKVEINCIQCRGRGYYDGVKCEACNHTGKVEQTCRFCGGIGKKPK